MWMLYATNFIKSLVGITKWKFYTGLLSKKYHLPISQDFLAWINKHYSMYSIYLNKDNNMYRNSTSIR